MTKWGFVLGAALTMGQLGVLGTARSAYAQQETPFRGRAAVAIVGAEPAPEGMRLLVRGEGEATQLGRFTREERLVLHADGTLEGTLTFTAANGDRLYGRVSGRFTGPATAEGECTFTGGTGRFRRATGGYTWVGVTTDGVAFSLGFEGTLGR